MSDRDTLLDELRPTAFAIAYRMLGSVSEAEDVVQEALLRVHQSLDAGEDIASPRAFVATITTRLAINELRSARARREHYVGEWLPVLARTLGAKRPMHVPRFVGRLLTGEIGAVMMTELRGASNAKAKRELGWTPSHASWREGFAGLTTPHAIGQEVR